MWLARRGARHRKRSGHHLDQAQPSEKQRSGSGLALAFGALLDGTPESAVIGVSLLDGAAVSLVTVGLRGCGVPSPRRAPSPRSSCTMHRGRRLFPGGDRRRDGGRGRSDPRDDRRHDDPGRFQDAHLVIGLVTISGFLVSSALSHT